MKGYSLTAKSKKNIRVLKLFIISLIFAGVAMSIAIIGCNYIGNRNFKETFYSVSCLKVNNKIRVLQISDLHNCTYGKDNEKLLDRVEKLKPDVIICTGDMVDSDAVSDERVLKLCTSLVKIAPSYYIYGNNEVEKYYNDPLTQDSLDEKFSFDDDNRNPSELLELTDEFAEQLKKTGIKVLKNTFDTVTVGTTNVDVYGVLTSNPSSFWSYGGESFYDYLYTQENNLKITAIHEPSVFSEFYPDTWGDLVLAGHTHGGVVKVPMIGSLYSHGAGLFPERNGYYTYGRSEVQSGTLIVSSGLENKNVFRINNPPEIVVVDINKF